MSYLKNTWYVAAWADQISQGELVRRQILGEYIVFFRDENNKPAALTDRCSHRFAPLSMGKLRDNCVQCPYHGLRFSAEGTCVHNPHGDGRIPSRSSIKSYPLAERYGAIWIWMGDPEKATVEKIPRFDFMDPEVFYTGGGEMNVQGNYQLETDNILDLSHIEFVHPLFSSPAVSQGKFSHEIEGETVWSKRDITNDTEPPEFIRAAFNVKQGPVDRWLHVHWQAPAYMSLYAGGVASGQAHEEGIVSAQAHWFTPETEYTTHYFFAISCPKSAGEWGAAHVKEQVKNLYVPFELEDAPIIEAQQRNIGDQDIMDLKPIMLGVDAAGNSARRILAKMIREEAQ